MKPRLHPAAAGWPRPGHWAALDWAAAIVLTLMLRGLFGSALSPASTSLWLGLAVAAALSFPAALRRRSPGVILGVLLAESVVLTIAGIPPTTWPLLSAAFVLYLIAATRPLRAGITALGLTAAVLALVSLAMLAHARSLNISPANVTFSAITTGLAVLAAWAIGAAVQQRRAYDQVLRAHRERQVQAELDSAWRSVTEERLRIARELHDVVAHSMTVIAVRAGVGHHVIDSQPEEARAALGVIETTARHALTEIRQMMGVLRQHDVPGELQTRQAGRGGGPAPGDARPSAELLPAPGLADLNQLLAQTAGAGVAVRVHVTGQRSDLPAGIDLTAYRIVQEALTNVARHSGSSHCQLTLGYRDDEILIEVTDRGADRQAGTGGQRHARPADPQGLADAPGQGHGIVGMRERVSLYGGQFSAAPLNGTGFRVTAVIPVPGEDQ